MEKKPKRRVFIRREDGVGQHYTVNVPAAPPRTAPHVPRVVNPSFGGSGGGGRNVDYAKISERARPAHHPVEVWVSPSGERAALNLVPMGVPDDGDDYWEPDGPGQLPPQQYALTNDAGDDVELVTVFPLKPWNAYDAVGDVLRRDGWSYSHSVWGGSGGKAGTVIPEPEYVECSHGRDADLCRDPDNHYGWD